MNQTHSEEISTHNLKDCGKIDEGFIISMSRIFKFGVKCNAFPSDCSSRFSEVGAIDVESSIVIAKFELEVDRVVGPSVISLLGVARELCTIDSLR